MIGVGADVGVVAIVGVVSKYTYAARLLTIGEPPWELRVEEPITQLRMVNTSIQMVCHVHKCADVGGHFDLFCGVFDNIISAAGLCVVLTSATYQPVGTPFAPAGWRRC